MNAKPYPRICILRANGLTLLLFFCGTSQFLISVGRCQQMSSSLKSHIYHGQVGARVPNVEEFEKCEGRLVRFLGMVGLLFSTQGSVDRRGGL